MIIKHISIFFPKDNNFYRRLYDYFEEAFKQNGILVTGKLELLDELHMSEWCSIYKPSIIFEMNRVKNEIPILYDLKIPHISWIVDFQGRSENDIDGSEITYFFDPGWAENYITSGFSDWLPPAACLKTFNPEFINITKKHQCDVSFIGHIPLPWSDEKLLNNITDSITFLDVLSEYERQLPDFYSSTITHLSLKNHIDRIVNRLAGADINLTREIYYDLIERLNRLNQRHELISYVLDKTSSIRIYGTDNWAKWSQYKKNYKGYIDSPKIMAQVFKSSSINLHDGVGFHFRSIECLASGGRLFHMRNKKVKHGLDTCFDNHFHYFEFNKNNFDELYLEAIEAPYFGSQAQIETFNIIKNHHSWGKRVTKMLKDIKLEI